MTIKEYFNNRNKRLGINMENSQVDTYILSFGLDGNEQVSDSNKLDIAYMDLVKDLLLLPNISEDDYSISYNRDSLLSWYRLEAKRLGIDDSLSSDNQVQDMSFLA